MNETDKTKLTERLSRLTEGQLKHICGRLIDQLEADAPVGANENLEESTAEERELVEQVASFCQLSAADSPSGRAGVVQFLVAVAEASPELAPVIQDALAELDHPNETLDFGLSAFVAGTLVLAIAAAIIRPRVTIQEEEQSTEKTTEKKTTRVYEVQGVNDIIGVIRAALPFLT